MSEPDTRGTRIQRLRLKRQLTQKQLAERVGVDVITVSRWERDASAPRVRVRDVVASTLGTTVAHLEGYEASPESFTLQDLARVLGDALQGAKSESAQRWADRRHQDRRRENVAVDRDRRRGERRALVAA